jgi:hypothetical protein
MAKVENAWLNDINLSNKDINLDEVETKPDDKKVQETSQAELAYILGDLQFLKNKQEASTNIENYKRRSAETFRELEKFITECGGRYIEDVNEIYKKYQSESRAFIARREDPERVVNLLTNKNIEIKFDPKVVAERGDKYANCAIWPYGPDAIAGIRNAFLEGRGMAGPLVSLIASRNNPENVEVSKPEERMLKVDDISREAVRIVSGEIKKEDLAFIIIRMQTKFFPPEKLTDKEKEKNLPQVFRGFIME